MKPSHLLTLALIATPLASFAATTPGADYRPTPSSVVLVEATKQALDLPSEERLQTLRTQGDEGYRNLVQIMKDEGLTMEPRWRATLSVGRLGGKRSLPELERAMKQNEWFMRSAGLLSMANVDHAAAVKWSRVLISDRALVVRAATVDVMADLKDASLAPVLWQKLYAKENFKNKKSLFVRRRIVAALGQLEKPEHAKSFVKILNDNDATLYPVAIAALENLTGQKLGQAMDTMQTRRDLWKKWAVAPHAPAPTSASLAPRSAF